MARDAIFKTCRECGTQYAYPACRPLTRGCPVCSSGFLFPDLSSVEVGDDLIDLELEPLAPPAQASLF